MKYKVTVILNDFKFLPGLPTGEEFSGALRGKCFSWESNKVDLNSLQKAMEESKIKSFKVKLAS